MDEIARVEQMVVEGLITAEEGERLKAVLRSVQEADELEATRAAEGVEAHDAGPATSLPSGDPPVALMSPAPIPPVSPLPAATVPEPTGARPAGDASAPAGTRWVRVDVVAGDLDVHVDHGLSEPKVTSDSGEATLEPTEYGYRVALGAKGDGFLRNLDGMFVGLIGRGRPGDVKLTLPAGYGVDLAKTAGDVDLYGVPYLRGVLTAGDLDAHGLEGVDLTSLAGDVFVSLCSKSGRHRIVNTAGELEVVLLPGSDVTVAGDVSIGDVKAGPEFKTGRRIVSETVSGTIGAGTAKLDLKVTAGTIKLRTGTDDRG